MKKIEQYTHPPYHYTSSYKIRLYLYDNYYGCFYLKTNIADRIGFRAQGQAKRQTGHGIRYKYRAAARPQGRPLPNSNEAKLRAIENYLCFSRLRLRDLCAHQATSALPLAKKFGKILRRNLLKTVDERIFQEFLLTQLKIHDIGDQAVTLEYDGEKIYLCTESGAKSEAQDLSEETKRVVVATVKAACERAERVHAPIENTPPSSKGGEQHDKVKESLKLKSQLFLKILWYQYDISAIQVAAAPPPQQVMPSTAVRLVRPAWQQNRAPLPTPLQPTPV
ncbi:unnamed protein product [Trichogramma brassicae]|uniref:Uncharacterized protein n=1 Tax=Trichogramma brassicae TaxID=86971 RepID=A0A6H5ISW7_9HYME|nr:unnamed protein product [Trichogramma brassicae]